ncbi:class I SAM-dependent methyltransferase [Flavisphingomonas formosensis]|uniref:class I SAM-dependent methyltransferase n=1 Tax=Flavisphingomonas formosensis TaxID=861534 RepID=UPI0012FBF8F0|nr:methyltransferase domain-containing protein [Sphingomonas formosensis]
MLPDPSALRQRMMEIDWFHRIEIAPGMVTPGKIDPAIRVAGLRLPEDLTGQHVLDVGAWDGFFSFEAERRGADRVVAIDSFCWSGDGWGSRAGFDFARQALGSHVEPVEMEVLDLDPARIGRFDIVLFLNVLYHMRNPALAIERVASVTRRQLILETHTDLNDVDVPAVALYRPGELWQDETSYCGPNLPALEVMLHDAGFDRVEIVGTASKARRMARALLHEREYGIPRERTLRQGWAVVHAYK